MVGYLFYRCCHYLYYLEGNSICKKVLKQSFHLPTVLLVIGYVIFWIELYVLRSPFGRTSWISWLILSLVLIGMLIFQSWQLRQFVFEVKRWWFEQKCVQKAFIVLFCILIFVLLLVGARAASLPPHLPQEYDSLNYHITVPRQHLIQGSFLHLPWSVADLFLLPLDFAMASYCLSTQLPNKIAFYFFIFGILGVSTGLVWRFSKKNIWACLAIVMAIFGLHGISIQIGIAMFDLMMLYLFLASVDSFIKGNWILAAIEFSFYFWSKSFIPIQLFVLGVILWIVFLIAKKVKWHSSSLWWPAEKIKLKTLVFSFVASSLLIGGPFVVKSLYYTGTPLYPFYPGALSKGAYSMTAIWPSIVERSKQHLHVRDQYGKGRNVKSLVEHFWILAIPEKGVNNRFDYPLGLPYLLVLGPFIFLFIQSLRKRKIDLSLWFCVLYWASWWLGSQQSRFLYVPVVMMFIVVLSNERFLRKSMLCCLLTSLIFSCLSIIRAHKADLFRKPIEVLRKRDSNLIGLSASVERSKPVTIDFEDAAFADFAVSVEQTESIFVLKQ